MSVADDPAAGSPGDDWDTGDEPARNLASGGGAEMADGDGAALPEGLDFTSPAGFAGLLNRIM